MLCEICHFPPNYAQLQSFRISKIPHVQSFIYNIASQGQQAISPSMALHLPGPSKHRDIGVVPYSLWIALLINHSRNPNVGI
jgi:hypothetical protein